MNTKNVILAAVFLASGCTSGADIAPKADAYLQALTDSGRFSGTVLLARDGKTLFAKGYGFANEASRLPNSTGTTFPVASVAKPFTATLVLQLQQRGALSIADPVCEYIAPCPDAWRAITLEHLLTHTSGVPDYTSGPDFLAKMRTPRTAGDIIASFRDLPLTSPPGTKYRYSNAGYFVLGAVIEKASGKPYAAVLEELILKPLGMTQTGFGANAHQLPKLAHGYQPRGTVNDVADYVDTSWLFAAGGIHSTVEDLAKFERALNTDTLLPRDALANMWSPERGEYGYGWQLLPPSAATLDRRLVFHAGGIPGYSTDLLRYPDDGVTVIILANQHPVDLQEISRNLSAIVFGEEFSMPTVRRAAKIDPSIYDAYAGRYEINPDVAITVTREGDQLAVQATGQPKDFAVPESESTFFSRVSPARLSFSKDASGKVDKLIIHDPHRDIPAPRK